MLRKTGVLAIVAVVSALAQRTTRTQPVRGSVFDTSGALVPDAIVTLKRGAASARPALVTGNSGDFRFDAVPDGTYSLAVQREGFKLSVTPLKLSARVLTPLRIELAIAGVSSEIAVAEAEVDYSGPGLPGLSDRRGGSPPAAP